MSKKVLIIGAGIGGLATAVRLLSRGYDVHVYEKEGKIGGKINTIETNDFKFDLTASILMTPDIYKEVFTWANKDYKDYLCFMKLDPIYRVNYSDNSNFDFYCDVVKLIRALEDISEEDSVGYIKFLGESYKKYLLANKYFLNNTFEYANDFFNVETLMKALQIKTFSNTYDYVSDYLKSEKLKQFICFQSLYVGISPYDGPNIYTLIPAISHLYGLWYIRGGMYSYIEALEKLIKELGGTIHTRTNVSEIIFLKNRAVGIKINSEIIKGDIIISNADFSYSMKNLIKNKDAKGKYTDKKIDDMKYSCSTFIIHIGLNKRYPKLLVHNIYIGDDFKENINAPFKGELSKKPSLYIYCPSRIDENMARKNTECLNIMVRVPNLSFENIRWDSETIKNYREVVIDTITKIKGLEDFEERIVYESYLTPKDLKEKYNSYHGTAFGLSHTLTQTNYFRPHIKSNKVDNLYFVGGSVHPGTGVSIVLQCSKIVAEKIMKDNEK